MLTHKTHPTLDFSDTLYSLIQYSQLLAESFGQDVGWTNLTITNSTIYGPVTGYTMQAKRLGKLVVVRGLLLIKSTASINDSVAVTMPVGWRPSSNTFGSATVYGPGVATPRVLTSGAVQPFVSGYYTGTPAVSNAYPVNLTYLID